MNWEEFNRELRKQFPALKRRINSYRAAFLDGPGGYQVPQRVIDAMVSYLIGHNANMDGSFTTSIETADIIDNARLAFADLFNCSPKEIVFGANMTTLTFMLSQALVRELSPGDRILITEIDHEGNRGPWEQLRDREMTIEEIAVNTETCILDMEDFERKLENKPKIVAINYASNGVGTINEVETIVSRAHEAGAYTIVDAVHYAAHGPIDVQKIGTDFLLCSVYKFFGPHIGAMYARKGVLEKLNPLKLRPQHNEPPYMIETGTLNHEGIAGASEAVEFIADCGLQFGKDYERSIGNFSRSRRNRIVAGLKLFDEYESRLTRYLIEKLESIEGIRIYGPPKGYPRTSTVSFTVDAYDAGTVSRYLDSLGLLVWSGDFFATRLIERLGLAERGGLVRIGIAPYNNRDELERVVDGLRNKEALSEYAYQERNSALDA